ncbi:hypothetical protein JTB14_019863 [Gonioctena quinquepunctata]|nr:hypothetical protein JTB14_019863 [Gonioctena quinquepunctata]
MSDYVNEQGKLQKFMNEFLSDDELEPFSAGSSEEFYLYSDSDSSLFEEAQRKKRNIGQGRSNVDETIDEVISTYLCEDESEEDSDERQEITWGPVTGLSMKKFDFQVHSVVLKDTLYATHMNKSTADFVSLFIDYAFLQHIATETNFTKNICCRWQEF